MAVAQDAASAPASGAIAGCHALWFTPPVRADGHQERREPEAAEFVHGPSQDPADRALHRGRGAYGAGAGSGVTDSLRERQSGAEAAEVKRPERTVTPCMQRLHRRWLRRSNVCIPVDVLALLAMLASEALGDFQIRLCVEVKVMAKVTYLTVLGAGAAFVGRPCDRLASKPRNAKDSSARTRLLGFANERSGGSNPPGPALCLIAAQKAHP